MARKKPTFDKKNLIDRPEILELAKISKAQLSYITRSDRVNFPKHIKRLGSAMLYSRTEVLAWLKTNDARAITFSPQERRQMDLNKRPRHPLPVKPKPALEGLPGSRFKIKPPATPKKTTVVHLEERNEYIKPHSGLGYGIAEPESYVLML